VNDDFENLTGRIPGSRTADLTPILRAHESRNVTYFSPEFPVFWESASGATVTDVDGNRYLDFTSAFGVANVGHGDPYVVSAIADQAARLMHGMGDVHPTEVRAKLLEKLPQVLPKGLSKAFLATTGSEAVEAALKTAVLATGKPHFAAFKGAYHGLSLGALTVCGLEKFRAPFAGAIGGDTLFLDYPRATAGAPAEPAIAQARAALAARNDIAAVIVEPIQARGGCIVPPPGFLAGLHATCKELGILLIFDEIYTGFGRTGTWFAAEHEGVVPDIMCIGKAFGSGFPISAAVARKDVMDAWPVSTGEALHTSTYLGNPMGCAAALATINELVRLKLPARARQLGLTLGSRLEALTSRKRVVEIRGRGLLWGVQMRDAAAAEAVVKRALKLGLILLQAGSDGDVISIAPPLVITDRQLRRATGILENAISATE
jgi:4-aminobutyrate aminotransferase-like enzyme